MAYADANFYQDIYSGTIPPGAALTTLLERASDDVDAMTFHRIPAVGGIDALTPFQQEQVKRAVCTQADYRNEFGDLIDAGLSGYHIGDVTVSAGQGGMEPYSPRARDCLLPTGFLNRGVPG